jgi:hypothetical protein
MLAKAQGTPREQIGFLCELGVLARISFSFFWPLSRAFDG